jgi:hypothetical protein
MRGSRRFQRTMITVLVGVNILFFSSSFYGDFKVAFAQSILAMGLVASLLLVYAFIQYSRKNKKSSQATPTSEEN